jgi:hypothetical protein
MKLMSVVPRQPVHSIHVPPIPTMHGMGVSTTSVVNPPYGNNNLRSISTVQQIKKKKVNKKSLVGGTQDTIESNNDTISSTNDVKLENNATVLPKTGDGNDG